MSEQEKKQQRIYDLLNAGNNLQRFSEIIGVYLNHLDYATWGVLENVLENKTNATSHPNIGSLQTATEEEWNKTHPSIGDNKRTTIVSSYLLLLQCSSYQFHLTWIVYQMGGKWLNS